MLDTFTQGLLILFAILLAFCVYFLYFRQTSALIQDSRTSNQEEESSDTDEETTHDAANTLNDSFNININEIRDEYKRRRTSDHYPPKVKNIFDRMNKDLQFRREQMRKIQRHLRRERHLSNVQSSARAARKKTLVGVRRAYGWIRP